MGTLSHPLPAQILPLEIMKETKRQLEKSKLVVASNVYRNLSFFLGFFVCCRELK
jgi:hypothetical protein